MNFNIVLLNVVMMSVVLLNAIMLSVVMMNAVMMNAVLMNVVAPTFFGFFRLKKIHSFLKRTQSYKTLFCSESNVWRCQGDPPSRASLRYDLALPVKIYVDLNTHHMQETR